MLNVQDKIEQLSSDRASLQAERDALKQEIIEAYGTDKNVNKIASRVQAIDLQLSSFTDIEASLKNAQMQAEEQKIVDSYEQLCKDVVSHIKEIDGMKKPLQDLQDEYIKLLDVDRLIRATIQAKMHRLTMFVGQLDTDCDKSAIASQTSQIKAKYPQLQRSIANSFLEVPKPKKGKK
jgi:regulator of replication initiation timing